MAWGSLRGCMEVGKVFRQAMGAPSPTCARQCAGCLGKSVVPHGSCTIPTLCYPRAGCQELG